MHTCLDSGCHTPLRGTRFGLALCACPQLAWDDCQEVGTPAPVGAAAGECPRAGSRHCQQAEERVCLGGEVLGTFPTTVW